MRDQGVMFRITGAALVLWAIALALPAHAVEPNRVYVTVDKSQVISFRSGPFKTVSVASPAIADVHVVSPTEILVNGKAPGITSLLVFYGGRIEHFDLVVHPAPAGPPRAPLVPSEEHAVEVQRAGTVSHHLFVRDTERTWVQLGSPKAEPEATKK